MPASPDDVSCAHETGLTIVAVYRRGKRTIARVWPESHTGGAALPQDFNIFPKGSDSCRLLLNEPPHLSWKSASFGGFINQESIHVYTLITFEGGWSGFGV